MDLLIKPLAEKDATEATLWYNTAREGLGDEFLLALEAKINAIQRNPEQFQIVYKNIRRAFTDRFPYGIFFIVEDEVIYVLSILHTSRNPKAWMKRK
ncbi:type II toxin-antitoxin system RelE/ParE family toxin [Plebeiibacterium marinum]|uniref:Type II toxin-antitoxin system RelE/ParE family toxin n=1 Tax=Plebeiibacterium marinum TaxID=2992111 RepID=A0AAE3MGP8_9BACT|nr:type II toxin-antitoxin system RelE/ParE family toxin [Plebeiobacterium marinum]MCW3807165.1 type II toxin-antitoxin system RelE/ParE family toxin [Plebeiobacterium marinum]